jgi:hypothetical protein
MAQSRAVRGPPRAADAAGDRTDTARGRAASQRQASAAVWPSQFAGQFGIPMKSALPKVKEARHGPEPWGVMPSCRSPPWDRWPGAVVVRQRLRHKTRKKPFSTALYAVCILQVMAVAWLVVNGPTAPPAVMRQVGALTSR